MSKNAFFCISVLFGDIDKTIKYFFKNETSKKPLYVLDDWFLTKLQRLGQVNVCHSKWRLFESS